MSEYDFCTSYPCGCDDDDDDFPYPVASTYSGPLFAIKTDDGMLCTDRYCTCGIELLAAQPNPSVVTAGSGEMFRWSPALPALRFGGGND